MVSFCFWSNPPGFNQTFSGEREDFTPEGWLGIESKWEMNDHQQIQLTNSLYPNLKQNADDRNQTTFDWILIISLASPS